MRSSSAASSFLYDPRFVFRVSRCAEDAGERYGELPPPASPPRLLVGVGVARDPLFFLGDLHGLFEDLDLHGFLAEHALKLADALLSFLQLTLGTTRSLDLRLLRVASSMAVRHLNIWLGEIPCRRATLEMELPARRASSSRAFFCSGVKRRRWPARGASTTGGVVFDIGDFLFGEVSGRNGG